MKASCATSSASVGRPDRRQGRPEDRPAVPLDQLAECLHVSRLGPPDQDEVGGAGGALGGFRDRHTVYRGVRQHGGWGKVE